MNALARRCSAALSTCPLGGSDYPSARKSARLAQDEHNVSKLQRMHKLDGVVLHDADGECVPLFPLQAGLGWERAFDEYAVGLDGHAAIREVEALFGDRWRLVGPADERRRKGKLYSTRAPVDRAFSHECGKRGASVGVARVLSELKAKYANEGGVKTIYSAARKDYS